jgi:hypothetical protein
MGGRFQGCFDLRRNRLLRTEWAREGRFLEVDGIEDERLAAHLPADIRAEFVESAGLASAGYPALDAESYQAGHLTPVVFGTALKEVCVRELLDSLLAWAPPPKAQPATPRAVEPSEPAVTGFVFKVQANMDPNHRDRVAFMRVCSGRFRRGMKLKQAATGKMIAINAPIFFFGATRMPQPLCCGPHSCTSTMRFCARSSSHSPHEERRVSTGSVVVNSISARFGSRRSSRSVPTEMRPRSTSPVAVDSGKSASATP